MLWLFLFTLADEYLTVAGIIWNSVCRQTSQFKNTCRGSATF